MTQTLVIMMGLQGSGKSTFYAKYLSRDFVRVNLDTLKTRHREKLLIESCIASRQRIEGIKQGKLTVIERKEDPELWNRMVLRKNKA